MDGLILKRFKEFVDKNREIIDENNFEEVYNLLYNEPAKIVGNFTYLFYKANIDPLSYLNYIPGEFLSQTDIISFNVPNHILSIGNASFYNCEKLEEIKLSKNLESIGSKAFAYCFHLKNIEIPDKVTKIDNGTFGGCSRLEFISIGKNMKYIEEYAFVDCDNLKDIYFKGNFEEFDCDINIYGNDLFFKAVFHCNDGDYKMGKNWNWVKL